MSGEVVTIFDELKDHIRDALYDMNGVSVDSNGFYTECYVDYRDELDDSDIADILAGRYKQVINGKTKIIEMPPMDVFNQILEDAYGEQGWDCRQDIINKLVENTDISRIMESFNISELEIGEYLDEMWEFKLPSDAFLERDVCMDIMLDTGDCNYEFTRNNLASTDIETVDDFDDNSSLLWLCEQQGVTREELLAAFDKGTAHSDEVENLRKQKNMLVEELKKYGYDVPSFNRSAHHSGAYKEYLELTDTISRYQSKVDELTVKFRDNDILYEEYQKKFFELHRRKAHLTKEDFETEKPKVLESLTTRLNSAEAILKDTQAKLEGNEKYKDIAQLCDKRISVVRHLSDLSKTDEYKKAEFINSVHNECANAYGSSVVTFLVKMTLEEAIKLKEVINLEEDINNSYYYENRKGLSSITIDKDACCGLMDDCNGGGSVFEIKLLKDVEVPVKALYKAVPDRCNGNYGFMEIYGADDESFKKSLKEINEIKQPKVNDLISDAQNRVENSNATVVAKEEFEIDRE